VNWFFGFAIFLLVIIVAAGIWKRAKWNWGVFLGLMAIAITLLFGTWSVTYQLRGARRQSVYNSYGMLVILSRLQGFVNCPPEEWIDALYDSSVALDKVEQESKEKFQKILW